MQGEIIKGFRFGMVLQVTIGPVCLYIFKLATETGLMAAESAVMGAVVMDALYVTFSIIGVGAIIAKPRIQFVIKYVGTAILIYFGLGVVLSAFGVNIIPSFGQTDIAAATSSAFVTSFILTASSPLSILFWSGVFATKIAHGGFGKRAMIAFGTGSVLATLVFLGIFALVASLLHLVISVTVIKVLNVLVGLFIMGFGVKMLIK